MKTTIEIPDEIMRMIKIKAAQEGYKIKDLVTLLLKTALSSPEQTAAKATKGDLPLPLIQCRPDAPIAMMTAQDVNKLLHRTLEENDLAGTNNPV